MVDYDKEDAKLFGGEGANDMYGDLDRFEKRMKGNKAPLDDDDSSSDDRGSGFEKKKPMSEVEVLKEKNRILMEKLFKS
jgi:hypothetical protein